MILLIFSSSRARADDADPAAEAYQQALHQYDAGDVAGALVSMRESLRLSGRPELLYNIARLEDELGDCSAALADYQQYLERVPQGQYRVSAERSSQKLSARCPPPSAAQPPASAPSPAAEAQPAALAAATTASAAVDSSALEPPPISSSPPAQSAPRDASASAASTQRWLGWSAIAAGGLAGAGAIYFTVSALDARSRFRDSVKREVSGGAYADLGLQDEQHRDERWAQVLGVTGGVLLGGGVALLLLGGRAPASSGVTAGVWLSPEGCAAEVTSRF